MPPSCMGHFRRLELEPHQVSFSCRIQLAPLLGHLGLVQSTRMSPLLKISVVVHAKCWYRPVSDAKLPTAREGPRGSSGFTIIFGMLREIIPLPPAASAYFDTPSA